MRGLDRRWACRAAAAGLRAVWQPAPGRVCSAASCASCQKKSQTRLGSPERWGCFARGKEEPFLPSRSDGEGWLEKRRGSGSPRVSSDLLVRGEISECRRRFLFTSPHRRCPFFLVQLQPVKANPRLADRRVTFQHLWVLQVFTKKGVREESGLTPVALHICAGPREKRSKVNQELENRVCERHPNLALVLMCSNTHYPGFRVRLSPGESYSGYCELQAVPVCAGDGVGLPVGSEYKDQNHVSLVLPPLFLILHVDRNTGLSVYLHVPD